MEPMQGKLASSQFDFGYTEQFCIPGVASCDSVVGDFLEFNLANRGSLCVWLGKRNCSSPLDFTSKTIVWVAISFSRGSSQSRIKPTSAVSCIAGRFFTTELWRKPCTSRLRRLQHSFLLQAGDSECSTREHARDWIGPPLSSDLSSTLWETQKHRAYLASWGPFCLGAPSGQVAEHLSCQLSSS